MMYWDLVLRPSVDQLVELLRKRTEDEAEFVEAKFFRLTGVEVYHVVVLNSSNGCKISEIL